MEYGAGTQPRFKDFYRGPASAKSEILVGHAGLEYRERELLYHIPKNRFEVNGPSFRENRKYSGPTII